MARKPTRLVRWYDQFLRDGDLPGFLGRIYEAYSVPTLARLLATGGRLVRRAAALAVGWNEGPLAAESLTRALRDRDRGVRLIAFSLLPEVWLREFGVEASLVARRATRLNESEDYRAALASIETGLRRWPQCDDFWIQRAIARYGQDDFTAAIGDLNEVLERNPNRFDALAMLGQCLLRVNRENEAIRAYRDSVAICPELESLRVEARKLERKRR